MATREEKRTAKAVGAEIRRLREARKWTLRDLASETGLDFGYVGKIERGENASIETYRVLAAALGLTLSALFATVDSRRPAARAARGDDHPRD